MGHPPGRCESDGAPFKPSLGLSGVVQTQKLAAETLHCHSPQECAESSMSGEKLKHSSLFRSFDPLYSAPDNEWRLVTPWWRRLELQMKDLAGVYKKTHAAGLCFDLWQSSSSRSVCQSACL